MIRLGFFQSEKLSLTADTLIGIVIVGVGLLILIKVFSGIARLSREQEQIRNLLKTGEPAQAKILKMWDTGSTLNNDPQVGLLLEVSPENRAPYQVELTYFVSRVKLPQVQTGNIIAVKIDKTDNKKVALDLV